MKILILIFALALGACGGPQKTNVSKKSTDTVTDECPCGKADLDTPPPLAPQETPTAP
jgi:hypothetical protein